MPSRPISLSAGTYRLVSTGGNKALEHLVGRKCILRYHAFGIAEYRADGRYVKNFAITLLSSGDHPETLVYINEWVRLLKLKRRRGTTCTCIGYPFPHAKGRGNCLHSSTTVL